MKTVESTFQRTSDVEMATTRHDRRPVRNALLKWQLQQVQKRIVETQRRLMRMAAPSPASSLGLNNRYGRRPTVRRPRPVQHHDPEEDALMTLIMEQEKREAIISNQHIERLKPSKIPKPPINTSVKNVTLRPTGQKLNAAGDFYSPVRPRESCLNNSSSGFRQSLNISRIKAPTPKRLVGASPRNPLSYDQMKTPDRWRTTAMRSNQEEVNESALKRWEEEDVQQADRLLEKAARDGDDEALWNDLFYGTKAARAKMNQLPEQPVVYSTSSFPEVFSRSRSNSNGSACYEDDQPKSPLKIGSRMLPSNLSRMGTSEQIMRFARPHSDAGSRAADSNAPTSTQTISEILASMEKSIEIDPVDGDLVAGDGKNYDNFSGGGDDGEQFSRDEVSANDSYVIQAGASSDVEFPRWSMIVMVSCLAVGTSGFFMEELMALVGLFSRRTPFTLSRVEQERMRNRVSVLQQELQGFQLSTSEIEVKSETVMTELRNHMDRMRLDREKHQDMLTNEMQELRRHIVAVTHELVEKERESIQAQLEELVKIQVVSEDETETPAGADDENEKKLEEATPEASIHFESDATLDKSVYEPMAGSTVDDELDRSIADTEAHVEQPNPEQSQEQVVVPVEATDAVAVSSGQTSSTLDNLEVQIQQTAPDEKQELVVAASKSPPEEVVTTQTTQIETAPQFHIGEIRVEHVQEVVVTPVPVLEQGGNKIDVSVMPEPKATIVTKSPRNVSGMSWDGILLLVGIMFLAACIVLRVYNINRRKRWFEERRKRRNQRALMRAQQRARAMAETQDDSDDWDGDVEEVSLMTPVRDSEDDEPRSELQRQSPKIDTNLEDNNQNEQISYSPAPVYRQATTEQRVTSSYSKSRYSRRSPLLFRQRSPRQRR